MQPQATVPSAALAERSISTGTVGSSARFAPVTSVIDEFLRTEDTGSVPFDSGSISRKIMAAVESVEAASPVPVFGSALNVAEGDAGSPATFLMRMPPSDTQLKALAAKQQRKEWEDQQRKRQPSPSKDTSFIFDDVPCLADFDVPAIAAAPLLHSK